MSNSESLQHKLERVRAPRVRITYDVETGGGMEMKEIPFVVGAIADLCGHRQEDAPALKERRFVEVDRDNFDSVLDGMKPRLSLQVDNKLARDGSRLKVDLRFTSLEDFHPERVAQQVQPLRELVEARRKLSDLLTRLDGNDKLEELLKKIVANPQTLKAIGYRSEESSPQGNDDRG